MYDEDEDIVELSGRSKFFEDFYLIKVFKKYGIMYGLLLLGFTLCYVIVLLPVTTSKLFKSLVLTIDKISGGDETVKQCLWVFLIGSLIGIALIWVSTKIADYILVKKYEK